MTKSKTEKKYPWAEIGDAVICGYIKPGVHQVYFERQEFDKRQWWLVIDEVNKPVRLTSINITTSDWREEFEEIMKDNNLVCGLPIKNYGEEYLKDKKQLADSIQSLLDQQEQRHQREMEEVRIQAYENVPRWYKLPFREDGLPMDVPAGLDKEMPQGGIVYSKGCNVCGGSLVEVRGKHPKEPKRKICPTCAIEILESIYDNCNGQRASQTTSSGQISQSIKEKK